jgi:hypothetical protein
MISFDIDPTIYLFTFAAIIFTIFFAYMAIATYGDKQYVQSAFCVIISIILFICTIFFGSIIYNTVPYTETITICNKDNSVIVSTEQKEYVLSEYSNYYQLDMKAKIGRTITAHVIQESWLLKNNTRPFIYAIDGPVPCGNITCDV